VNSDDEPSPYEHGLYVLKSADGIHWRPVRDKPVITQGKFDSHNIMFPGKAYFPGGMDSQNVCLFFDTRLGKYVA
jgi:hypothetical protein